MNEQTFTTVKQIIVNMVGCDEAEVVPTATLAGDLNVDVMDLIEIVGALAEDEEIIIPQAALNELLDGEALKETATVAELVAIAENSVVS